MFRKLIRSSCFVQHNLRLYLFNSWDEDLRKAEDKEYVVILDFIGNYQEQLYDSDCSVRRSKLQQR